MTPRQVGPYRIVNQIGRGGMAVVYLAKQPVLGRSVALKELAPFLAGDPSLAERFIREARVAGSLNHPNVVTVFDFLEQDGVPYIAMEYLERGSLRPFVGRMSAAQVAGVLEGLLAALSHAEAMRIVHRDVKPENLLITGEGGVKIADFGIAKALQQVATEEMLTPAGATVGTPAYMAPEQAMAQEIGPWTDLYQTGVVAYELLAGEVPFRSEGAPVAVLMKHITDPVPELPAGTNPALAAWVKRLMAKEPGERPASARVAWNELEEIIVESEGPLWRRDARLGEHEPTVEHPTPLTPARFSSWQEYSPGASGTAPPPPPPPSGYVDYAPAREEGASPPASPPPAEPEPAPPATPDPPASATPAPPPRAMPEPAPPATPEPAPRATPEPAPRAMPEPAPPATPEPAPPATPAAPATGFFDDVPGDAAAPREPLPPEAEPREPLPAELAPSVVSAPVADETPTVAPRSPAQPPRRRRPALIGLAALAAVAVVALIVLTGGGDDPTPTPTPTASATPTATATQTAEQRPAGPFPTGEGPDGVAIGAGAVWVAASGDGTLTRIDPNTGDTTSVEVGENPDSVVVAFDSVWVSVTGEDKVVRLSDGAQPRITDEYDVGARPEGLATSSRAIWVANSGDGSVSQIVEATGDVRSVPDVGGEPVDLAVGAGAVWVADASGRSVTRVDGGRLEVAATVGGIGPNPRAVAIVGRDVWVATSGDGRAWRIDADANRATGDVRVGGTPRDIATDGEFLYVTDREGDRLVTIDPQAEQAVERETVEDGPLSVAAGEDDLWVTRFDAGDVARIARR